MFVRVSPRDSRYFELSDGKAYIPIGLNLIHPDTVDAKGLARMEEWMGKLSSNGGNYIRVWISSPFWDVEHQKSGVYDGEKAKRIDAMLEMAKRYGIKVKLTMEHFRTIEVDGRQKWAHKPIHHISMGGPATNLADFFAGEKSREQFKRKIEWFRSRYGDNPAIFGWELWNEVNAVATGDRYYMPWTEVMLGELHRLFPKNMAMQSLGSFDRSGARDLYRRHSLLKGNDIAQVHRYLDLGAELEVCHGPVDVLAADAVRELLSYNPGKPVILAESGAVEPRHTGPFKLYGKDRDGIILHDVLFAPFFAGAAGAGQIWHWDVYVDRNNLWYHFGRFAEAVKDVDPAYEHFIPSMLENGRLRVYVLSGEKTVLVWCRDSKNDWMSELRDGVSPELVVEEKVDLTKILGKPHPKGALIYDPWKNAWTEKEISNGMIVLPQFTRSVVVKIKK
ncbi:MAG: cellulase family glycosylhydrolase [Verrucomicrobiae bacterium]|nr:cellulase family glycosylhydrolase [Verrucomicrobiae bacterium]